MASWLVQLCFISLLFDRIQVYSDVADGNESELTITVDPGIKDCFFQSAKAGDVLEIEYQVVDSNIGEVELKHDLEINFLLYSPTGRQLVADFKKQDAVHRHEVKETGDYKICFDNTISRFASKTIYFEVYVENDDYNDRWDNLDLSFPPEMMYNDTVEDIKVAINSVRDNLNKIKHYQDQMRALEARDRNIQEHNFTRVNNFSAVTILIMLFVGAIQVLLVRSLFEEKSRLHKIFKMMDR